MPPVVCPSCLRDGHLTLAYEGECYVIKVVHPGKTVHECVLARKPHALKKVFQEPQI
jgi:hypothetical protein